MASPPATNFSDAVVLTIAEANAYAKIVEGLATDPDVLTPGGSTVPTINKVLQGVTDTANAIIGPALAAQVSASASAASALIASAIVGTFPNSAETTVPSGVAVNANYWAVTADGNYIRQWKNNAGTPQIGSPIISIPTSILISLFTGNFQAGLSELGRGPLAVNLYDSARSTVGSFVNTAGSISANAAYTLSDKMRVVGGGSYSISAGCAYRFLDIAGNYIAASYGAPGTAGVVVAPATAFYYQFSAPTTTLARYMVVPGTVLPTVYVGPGFYDKATGLRQILSAALAATYATLPSPLNVFDQTRCQDGFQLSSTGIPFSQAGFSVTPLIGVIPGASYITNISVTANASSWYDQDGNWLRAFTIVANTPIAVPADASYVRFQMGTATKPAVMFLPGSTMSASYVSFGFPTSTAMTLIALQLARQAAATSRSDDANILNPTDVLYNTGLTYSNGSTFGLTGWQMTPYLEVNPGDYFASTAGTNAISFYDQNKTYLGSIGVTATFNASVAVTTGIMTVTSMIFGVITAGDTLTNGVTITSQLSGTTGGAGTYQTSTTTAIAAAILVTIPTCVAGIAGQIMTVASVNGGSVLTAGMAITFSGISGTCRIVRQISGTAGGAGVYCISTSQTLTSGSAVNSVPAAFGGPIWTKVPAGVYYTRFQALGVVLSGGLATFRQGKINTVEGSTITATTAGAIMTVVTRPSGTLRVGDIVYGVGMPANCSILPFGTSATTGTGALGTYALSVAPGADITSAAPMVTSPSAAVAGKSFGGGGAVYPSAGKRIGFFGNSQTNNQSFQASVIAATGMIQSFSNGNPGADIGALAGVLGTVDLSQTDIVFWQEGHNEWGGAARPLGALTDASGANTTYGKCKQIIDYFYAQKPSIIILMGGPTYRAPTNIASVIYTADTTANAQGVTGQQIDDAMRLVAQSYGIPYVELRRDSNINAKTETGNIVGSPVNTWTNEGLHWSNAGGGPRVGRLIAAKVNACA